MSNRDTGLNVWQRASNHNRMIELQRNADTSKSASVELAYFGSSAFRITSPLGISIMIDPWRNHPSRKWDWYFRDFPEIEVDIGVSTHAHFDHDALHRLDAHVLLDRLIGTYTFCDVSITGIADKHASDSSAALYDFKKIILELDCIDITPPANPRSWDNCLMLVETGGLRILHWGDNRHNPADEVWQALGQVDVLLIPVDNSQHVLSHDNVDAIIDRLQPKITVPHHYYIWDVIQRQSTLMPVSNWLERHSAQVSSMDSAIFTVDADWHQQKGHRIVFFGDHVAFDSDLWRKSG